MSQHSRISSSVSPLLWLVPVPFVLAMCLPVQPRSDSAPGPDAAASAQTLAQAASAAQTAR